MSTVVPVIAADGACFELLCLCPEGEWRELLYWLPAMGMPARQYLQLAEALVERGVAVVLHEWRGIGSSTLRAGRRANWGYRSLLVDDLPPALAAVHARWPQAHRWLGGHSLGGQISALYAALHPADVVGLLLVASGAPYWRCFRHARAVQLGCTMAPWLAAICGYLPGRRLGFAGNEARALITDWARSARSGRYAVAGMPDDLEQRLAAVQLPTLALRLADDWMGPPASLAWLLGKMPQAACSQAVIDAHALGCDRADHFGWMRAPVPIASRIAGWIAARVDAGA